MIVEVSKNLFVGNETDYEKVVKKDMENLNVFTIHACKEPYHRNLLKYRTVSAPKGHPHYLYCITESEMFMNLVDSEDPKYINDELVKKSIDEITRRLNNRQKVFIHCNKGESRSPTIAFCFMMSQGTITQTFEELEKSFKLIYPPYNPNRGMREYAMRYYENIKSTRGA